MFYLIDPEDQANVLPRGKNPVLSLVPLIFITNLRGAATACKKTLDAIRIPV